MFADVLRDIARLHDDLGLVAIGYHRASQVWKSLEDMQRIVSSRYGKEWLNECNIRFFVETGWRLRWRYFFSQKLGFRWIPDSIGDSGPFADYELTSADVQLLMKSHNFSVKDLAAKLSFSDRTIRRVLNGQQPSARMVAALTAFRDGQI